MNIKKFCKLYKFMWFGKSNTTKIRQYRRQINEWVSLSLIPLSPMMKLLKTNKLVLINQVIYIINDFSGYYIAVDFGIHIRSKKYIRNSIGKLERRVLNNRIKNKIFHLQIYFKSIIEFDNIELRNLYIWAREQTRIIIRMKTDNSKWKSIKNYSRQPVNISFK